MTVRWANVAVLALVIFAGVFFVKNREELGEAFSMMNHIGNYQSTPNEQFSGLWIFGLIGLIIVAVTKIIVERNRDGGNDD